MFMVSVCRRIRQNTLLIPVAERINSVYDILVPRSVAAVLRICDTRSNCWNNCIHTLARRARTFTNWQMRDMPN